MARDRRHSLVRETLLRVALGAVLLMALLTMATYRLFFHAIEDRVIQHLDQYVVERAAREETNFIQIVDNLNLAARAFLERYDEPDPPGFLGRWEDLLEKSPDGAWRTPRSVADGSRDTTMWVRRSAPLTDEFKRRTLILYEVHEKFRPAWIGSFTNLWAVTPESADVGFDPLLPNRVYDLPADMDLMADPALAQTASASAGDRRLRWTHALADDAAGDYYVSALLPVYIGDRPVATFGHYVRVARMITRDVRSGLGGFTHMIVQDDGVIIAHPDKRAEIMRSHGAFSMNDDPILSGLFRTIISRTGTHFAGYDEATKLYYAVQRLEGPGWMFVTTLPRSVIAQDAFRRSQWVLWMGGAAMLSLLAFLAVTLRRSVARPLAELTQATEQLSAGSSSAAIEIIRQDELGQLAAAFNRMSGKVAERDAEMRQLNLDLEQRIVERTAELRTSEARVRAMLENTPGVIVVIDAETGHFRTGNEMALRALGLTREQLRERGPLDVSPPTQEDGRSSADVLREAMDRALAGSVASFEWIHYRFDGVIVPCEVRLSRLPANDRSLLIATIIDISTRKKAEARLLSALEHERELNELKTNFVSMVSHEFRTPLGIISSSAEIIGRYFDRLSPAMRQEHLDTIVRSTRVLGSMMEEVLLLGRFESGSMQFAPKPIALAAFCRTLATEVMAATGQACPITFSELGAVDGALSDEFLVRHIFTNLLSNAVKYSPPGAPIAFTVEREGNDAIFRIVDRGIGIPPEDRELLFKAFRRGGNVGQRAGTGLGLVIVQRCVQLHGGQIHFDSEPGKGTCVSVRLPVFDKAGGGPGSVAPRETPSLPSV